MWSLHRTTSSRLLTLILDDHGVTFSLISCSLLSKINMFVLMFLSKFCIVNSSMITICFLLLCMCNNLGNPRNDHVSYIAA